MPEREITISSTSATQEELEHAVSENWRTPPTKPEESEAKPAETVSESEPESPRSNKEGKSEQEAVPRGVQKRFDKLTARAKAAEAERDRLLDRIAAFEKGNKAEPEKKPATTDPEPKLEDFRNRDEWLIATAKWQFRQEAQQAKAKEAAEAENARMRQTFDAHNERLSAARDKYEDFDDSLKATDTPWKDGNQADIDASKAFQIALFESDNGPDILYYLSKNPAEFAKFAGKSPVRVTALVGALSERLGSSAPLPSAAPKTEKPKSKAPAPIKPVGSTSSPSDVPLEQMSYQQYKKAREAGRTS